jgi:hypothetical protein
MTSFTPSRRIFGFDILRIVSMFAITIFHVNEAVFWEDLPPLHDPHNVYWNLFRVAQRLTFSGFTVIALSFFLMGRSSRKNYGALLGFITLGIFVMASFQESPPFSGFYFEWDIYSFLAVTLVFVQLLVFLPQYYPLLAAFFFAATWIPVWDLIPNSASPAMQALVGVCPPEGVASWPLMPWLAWPLLFFCLGGWLRNSPKLRAASVGFTKKEALVWGVVLAASLPFYGAFIWIPTGPHFYCSTLRIDPVLFWATLVWVVFIMRISMIEKVNLWLAKKSWAQGISKLSWNTRFGFAYLAHLPLLGLGIFFKDAFLQHPWLFDLYYLSILPAAELLVRVGESLIQRWHNRVRTE